MLLTNPTPYFYDHKISQLNQSFSNVNEPTKPDVEKANIKILQSSLFITLYLFSPRIIGKCLIFRKSYRSLTNFSSGRKAKYIFEHVFFQEGYTHNVERPLHDSCGYAFFTSALTALSRCGFQWFLCGQNLNQNLVVE
jgi:hypothetical protein